MITHSLDLPARERKPRTSGLTMAIDNGLPTRLFADLIESGREHLDIVKFGWGTALVTPDFQSKVAVLRDQGVSFMFGGTLFEKHVSQGRLDEYIDLCHQCGCRLVEVSNGTIDIDDVTKAKCITRMAEEFEVVAEVGYKDQHRSEMFSPSQWIDSIRSDLDAGAEFVILEARESGASGICRSNGELRFGLIEDILSSGIEPGNLMFEAPTKAIQTYFVLRLGVEVNLGNIALSDLIALESLRLGLRADTLLSKGLTGNEISS
jgi:phosphosulfolactate synthase